MRPEEAPKGRFTVRPVRLEGEAASVARPVLLDEFSMRVGGPIWVELRHGYWRQGTILTIVASEVEVRLVEADSWE